MALLPAVEIVAIAVFILGLAAGYAVQRLLRLRLAGLPTESPPESPVKMGTATGGSGVSAPADGSVAASPPNPLPLAGRLGWLHGLLLACVGAALVFHPGLGSPIALSQALLLLYLLYPLAWVDLLTLTVEPGLVIAGIAARMGSVLLFQREQALEMIGGMLGGAGLLYLVGFFYRELRGRVGLGDGDAALLGLIGAFVGWQGLLPVVILSAAGGIIAGAPALLLLRKPLDTPLPFAPFLCGGGLIVYLLQAGGFHWRLLSPWLG